MMIPYDQILRLSHSIHHSKSHRNGMGKWIDITYLDTMINVLIRCTVLVVYPQVFSPPQLQKIPLYPSEGLPFQRTPPSSDFNIFHAFTMHQEIARFENFWPGHKQHAKKCREMSSLKISVSSTLCGTLRNVEKCRVLSKSLLGGTFQGKPG